MAAFAVTVTSSSQLQGGEYLESLSSERNFLLALSSSGDASLTNLHFPLSQPETVTLNTRSWASHLCLDSAGPYAAFGTSSTHPLRVYSIKNDELSRTPNAILHSQMLSEPAGTKPVSSAVYGISRAPLASPWGSSPQILVSGWFDGHVRCHDLRSSSRIKCAGGNAGEPAPLRPVLTMKDPLQFESFYSVSCGGGSSSHIAAGSARHSVVSFWDTMAGVFMRLETIALLSIMSSLKVQGYMAPHKADPLYMTLDLASIRELILSYLKPKAWMD
ncbi:hypothetical protein DXG01_011965 [Tephrocybe rancida]|nr:hypothetical protein DXG01_011965 [Tephrocybe rancida]